jgi:hypothetical protein
MGEIGWYGVVSEKIGDVLESDVASHISFTLS